MLRIIKRELFAAIVITLLVQPSTTLAALQYGYDGANLVLDTDSGLVWLPANVTDNELAELSQHGRNLRAVSEAGLILSLIENNFGIPTGDPFDQDLANLLVFLGADASPGYIDLNGWYDTQIFGWEIAMFEYIRGGDAWHLFWISTIGSYGQPFPCPQGELPCSDNVFRVMDPIPIPAAIWLFLPALLVLGKRRTPGSQA